jgi:hypothetical protein
MGEFSTNAGAEKNVEKGPEKVAMEQDKALGEKVENITETRPVSRRSKIGQSGLVN